MRIDVITILPELMESPLSHSILKRAREKGLLEVQLHNLRDYTPYKHGQVDDYQYGGGAGMVMMAEPLVRCIESLQKKHRYDEIIYMTPDGHRLQQKMANRLSMKKELLIIAGHYKGIDERVREHFVSMEISIGDYVLTGGELPALVLIDAIGRLLPGVLGDESSALSDSFQDGILSPPVYTRPAEFRGWKVPDVLLSGNFAAIEAWREEEALKRTRQRRPDLLDEE